MNDTVLITKACKANPLGSFKEIPSQIIIINGEIPTDMTLSGCKQFYEEQAQAINRALSESLPQGTYGRLGIMFMQHKLSLYQGRTETAF